jgi:hypothetical protein
MTHLQKQLSRSKTKHIYILCALFLLSAGKAFCQKELATVRFKSEAYVLQTPAFFTDKAGEGYVCVVNKQKRGLMLYELKNGVKKPKMVTETPYLHRQDMRFHSGVIYSKGTGHFATIDYENIIKVWSSAQEEFAQIDFKSHSYEFGDTIPMVLANTKQHIAYAQYVANTSYIKVCDYSDIVEAKVKTFKVEGEKITHLYFSPADKYLVATTAKQVYCWEMASGTLTVFPYSHVQYLTFAPNEKGFAFLFTNGKESYLQCDYWSETTSGLTIAISEKESLTEEKMSQPQIVWTSNEELSMVALVENTPMLYKYKLDKQAKKIPLTFPSLKSAIHPQLSENAKKIFVWDNVTETFYMGALE